MNRRTFLQTSAALVSRTRGPVLDPESFRHHEEFFRKTMPEEAANEIPDVRAWQWMKDEIPLFTCPDRDVEQIYYFRWWTFRKHIKKTPRGLLVTEFLKPVKHAGEYNALSCAFGHHMAEARWLRDPAVLHGDFHFWLHGGDNGGLHPRLHQFSGWTAASRYDAYLARADRADVVNDLPALIQDYEAWERERLLGNGLFWQRDVSDGMEESISGGRHVKNIRPSINSYMYGNARAIAEVAGLAGDRTTASKYSEKAEKLRTLVVKHLWNGDAAFFETVLESGKFAQVREEIGFTPWYFDLPEPGKGFEAAWRQLVDPQGFYAPFGPTTAEQRHPGFKIAYEGDDCQWNGPSWPFATTITLRALANVLSHDPQDAIRAADYCKTFLIYTQSQHRKLDDGRVIPWIDEDLNPFTGEWLARAMKLRKSGFYGRGDHYNHSGYADLVITGLAGLRPRADDKIEIQPLAEGFGWDWFCLDRLPYHGRMLTLLWDRNGARFARGRGFALYADGREIARTPKLGRLLVDLHR
jgi:Mannosylglycerate hydrolase MGH1-like glycoside hydrolase domain